MEEKRTRRKLSPEMKAAVLKAVLKDKRPVSEVCEAHDIGVTQFYSWQAEAFERLHTVFEPGKENELRAQSQEVTQLKDKLHHKTQIMFEFMEEHVKLKKSLGLL